MSEGDPACWLHLVCEQCGGVIEGNSGHRPGCEVQNVVQEIDVPSLPAPDKHPTILRVLDKLVVGEVLRLSNDHDPAPLRQTLQRSAPGVFDWEYLERGPDVWRVNIRRMEEGKIVLGTTLAYGPTILED